LVFKNQYFLAQTPLFFQKKLAIKMSKIEARLFKGTRDFLPEQMVHREAITDTMRAIFKKYGFSPMETPAIEYLSVLSGKYGEDADRLIYKLNYKTNLPDEAALHYDLTVPLSRVIAMNGDLEMPFKRYQIQPVWRADRPQPHQGRFREFVQCDCDVIGTTSMLVDAELIAITVEVLKLLGFEDFKVKINNRKILNGITTYLGLPSSATALLCRSIDKLDKMPWEDIEKELISNLNSNDYTEKLRYLFNNNLSYSTLKETIQNDEALEGFNELDQIFEYLKLLEIDPACYMFDVSLARGLDYYTGPIFETKLIKHPHIGSLTGGGRYDNMIGLFTGKSLPAVGTTLGLDRIYTAMQQLDMLSKKSTATKLLVANFDDSSFDYILKATSFFRKNNIAVEIYPEKAKLKKQFSYAEKKGIPYLLMAGGEEVEKSTFNLKNIITGEQKSLSLNEVLEIIK
jgi:histidyl-tRNA synthetase